MQELDLEQYKAEFKLKWREVAARVGANGASQAFRWATGQERPDAETQERIVKATGGLVTVHAMHRKRLAWERQHRTRLEADGPPQSKVA